MRCTQLLCVAAAAVLLALAGNVHSQYHTEVETLDDSCDAQLDQLWGNYTTPPVAPVAGCDYDCLTACYNTLQWAIYSEQQQHCPTQDEIIACFHPYRAQWYKFVESCAFFAWGATGGAEGEGDASTTTTTTTTTAGTTSEGAVASEGAAPVAASEGALPEGAVAGRRRVLLQEAEAALGDGGVDVWNGCFPSFATSEDFELYMNGEYVWNSDSASWGIALSVVFFTTLVLVGFGLPAFVKKPMAKGWAATKRGCARLNCFKRKPSKMDGPVKMDAPAATPAAEVAADGDTAAPAS